MWQLLCSLSDHQVPIPAGSTIEPGHGVSTPPSVTPISMCWAGRACCLGGPGRFRAGQPSWKWRMYFTLKEVFCNTVLCSERIWNIQKASTLLFPLRMFPCAFFLIRNIFHSVFLLFFPVTQSCIFNSSSHENLFCWVVLLCLELWFDSLNYL